jgi:hypothetical protein
MERNVKTHRKTKKHSKSGAVPVAKKVARKRARKSSPRRVKSRPGYDVVGTTSDGVLILRPKVKPTHFTSKEILETIMKVERAARAK